MDNKLELVNALEKLKERVALMDDSEMRATECAVDRLEDVIGTFENGAAA